MRKCSNIARRKELVAPDAELAESEIDNLLFLPGFSTASSVTNLSGRGVGLDVVKSAIRKLGGRVSITSSPGQGTTMSISLPLTLAVLDGMVVDVAGQTMVVPITAIVETMRPTPDVLHELGSSGLVVKVRDRFIPVIDLGGLFGQRRAEVSVVDMVLLLVETDAEETIALAVDRIYDQRQIVIKGLETNYGHVPCVAAATILGDGKIALIIDPEETAAMGRQGTAAPKAEKESSAMATTTDSETDLSELVTFRVGEQDFCVDIMTVREIRGWSPATSLPHAPPYVMGVMNLRGSVVPIVDLSARLGLGPAEPDPRHVVVIAVVGQQTVGFLVNAVSDVIGVPKNEVQPTPAIAADSSGAFIEGVIALKDRMLRLLDLGALLPPAAEGVAA